MGASIKRIEFYKYHKFCDVLPPPLRPIESSDSLSVLLCYFWISHMLMPAKIGIDEMVTNCPKYDNWVCICESRFFGLFIGVPLWSFKIVFLTHNLWLPGTVCQVPYWMTRGLIIILWHEGSSGLWVCPAATGLKVIEIQITNYLAHLWLRGRISLSDREYVLCLTALRWKYR